MYPEKSGQRWTTTHRAEWRVERNARAPQRATNTRETCLSDSSPRNSQKLSMGVRRSLPGSRGGDVTWFVVVGDEFDLEAVAVLEVASVVIGSASVGMAVREQERPTVVGGLGDELVEL